MSGSLVKVRYWDGWILGVRLIMLLLKMVVVIGEVALVVGKGGCGLVDKRYNLRGLAYSRETRASQFLVDLALSAK
jgi:hypothetical protein